MTPIPPRRINEIVKGKRSLTVDTALAEIQPCPAL